MTAPLSDPFRSIYDSETYRLVHQGPLLDFPWFVDIELTNDCDLGCLVCYRQVMDRPVGRMTDDVFLKTIDECAGLARVIRFSGQGEALIHKRVFDWMAEVKKRGLLLHLTTNGNSLNADRVEALLDTGIDRVKFSCQGVDAAGYEGIRQKGDYGRFVRNVTRLVKRRRERGLDRPFVQVSTTVLDEPREAIEDFLEFWRGKVDDVYWLYTELFKVKDTPFGRKNFHRQKVKLKTDPCFEVFTKIQVLYDGRVSACCSDYNATLVVGDVRRDSLAEIWRSDQAGRIRDDLARGQLNKYELCRTCTATM